MNCRAYFFLAVVVGSIVTTSTAHAFTAGNIVVMRGGDVNSVNSTPSSAFASGEVPAYLDEYSINVVGSTATASYVGSYTIPTSTLTLPGIFASSHEGRLEISGNGQFLNFAGYQQAVGAAATRNTAGTGGANYYQVGQVKYDGMFSNTALDIAVSKPQFVRAAYSNDGTQAWVGSKYVTLGNPSPNGGLEYISNFGTGSATTVELQSSKDYRDLKVVNGQLYGSSGSTSSTFKAVGAIGTGSPTSGSPTELRIGDNNTDSISSFAMMTLPGGTQPINGISGANVVYGVGDDFLTKSYVDPNKTPIVLAELLPATKLAVSLAGVIEGIVAKTDPNNATWVDLFVQISEGVYFGIDQSGTSTGSIAGTTFSKIVGTAGLPLQTGGSLYGISVSPVPEPSTFVLAALSGVLGVAAMFRKPRKQA
jgi:hypothetical protein